MITPIDLDELWTECPRCRAIYHITLSLQRDDHLNMRCNANQYPKPKGLE